VPSVSPLSEHATVGELAAKLDGETANLEVANSRKADVIAIVAVCDARMAQAAAQIAPKHPAWQFWKH